MIAKLQKLKIIKSFFPNKYNCLKYLGFCEDYFPCNVGKTMLYSVWYS